MTTPPKTGEFVSGKFFSNVRYEAARRNIPFDLDITFLDSLMKKQKHRCVYSGMPIDARTRGAITASLDRIDSNRGYFEDNVQFVLKDVNYMKWTLEEEKFLSLIEKIYFNSVQ